MRSTGREERPPAFVEGHDITPLLKNPAADWPHPAITTHGRGNHAVRTETHRYIRYANGEEELYDHSSDPHEWHNLATGRQYASVKDQLAVFLSEIPVEQGSAP